MSLFCDYYIILLCLQQVPLTVPPVPVVKAKTEDDLKALLLGGLDDPKPSSTVTKKSVPYESPVKYAQAGSTTDGSGGFNSGGDVADITSDGNYLDEHNV